MSAFSDGKWTGDDPAIVRVLQTMWDVADRAPWRGFAARGHVLEMAQLLGGEAELVGLPEYDDPDPGRSIADRLGIDLRGLSSLSRDDLAELLDPDELSMLSRAEA